MTWLHYLNERAETYKTLNVWIRSLSTLHCCFRKGSKVFGEHQAFHELGVKVGGFLG